MKIGIIGSGVVGQTLGKGFADLGHEVKIGSREPQSVKIKDWAEKTKGKATSGTVQGTAVFGELLIIATLGSAVEDAIFSAGIDNFIGKVVIDVTNPLDFTSGKPPKLSLQDNSNGELIQNMLPDAFVVKTLNIIGNAHMVSPKFEKGKINMLLCGNDKEAKKKVTEILKDFGWENITDLGGIEHSREMENLGLLWAQHGLKNNNWKNAYKKIRK